MKCRFAKQIKIAFVILFVAIGFLIVGIALLGKAKSLDDKVSGIVMCGFAVVMLFFFIVFIIKQAKSFLTIEDNKIKAWVSFGIKCDRDLTDLVDFEIVYNSPPATTKLTATLYLCFKDKTVFVVSGLLDADKVENFLEKKIERKPFKKQDKQTLLDNSIEAKKKIKGRAWLFFTHVALFLASVAVAIGFTGGKEIDLFSNTDWIYFYIFCIVAPYTFLASLFLVFLYADQIAQKAGLYNIIRRTVALTENLPVENIVKVVVSLDYKRRYVVYKQDNELFNFNEYCRFDKISIKKQDVIIKEIFADKNVQEVKLSPFILLKEVTQFIDKTI